MPIQDANLTPSFGGFGVNYQNPALPGEEIHLVELGTEITGEWAVLREQLIATNAAGFSDKDIRDLKQEAIRSRPEAVPVAPSQGGGRCYFRHQTRASMPDSPAGQDSHAVRPSAEHLGCRVAGVRRGRCSAWPVS